MMLSSPGVVKEQHSWRIGSTTREGMMQTEPSMQVQYTLHGAELGR